MKGKHLFLAAILAILAVVVLTGCGGGSKSQNADSPWRGSIIGVDTLPPNDEVGTAVTSWIKVYWPDANYEPPSSFTFKLYQWTADGWAVVRTIAKDSAPDNGEWWFAPEHNLAYDTDYRMVVTDNYGDSHTHYFTTEYDPTRAKTTAAKRYMPEGGGKSGGTAADEQVIKTRP
jgi:hypothetical protein